MAAKAQLRSSSFVTRQAAKPEWLLVDAQGQVLGRLAARVSRILQGKHKPTYTPHVDCGDYVVVVNARGIKVTGSKLQDKQYVWHTRWMGGLKTKSLRDVMQNDPPEAIKEAVRLMLPKTKLGKSMFKKLKVYADAQHDHAANRPKPYVLPD